jgi:glycosyltransferase involved in cell wall biosynthesis
MYEGMPAPPILLYVGRLDPEKGVETLLRALPTVLSRHTVSLLLCGQGVQESTLRRLAKALGIAARVRFMGVVGDDQLPALYRAATVFVMPSPHELQSIATLEAMASGLPVIAAHALALPELVEDGRNGLLFPPGEALALAHRVISLLADSTRAAHMGRKSREVAEGHDIESSLQAFEALYHHLQASKRDAESRAVQPGSPAAYQEIHEAHERIKGRPNGAGRS